MRASSVREELRAALDALILVQSGRSERAATMNALGSGESSRKSLRDTLSLVSATLANQDELNKLVTTVLPIEMTLEERWLANLTAWIIRYSDVSFAPEGISYLRELAPDDFRRDFEYLLGVLQSSDDSLFSRESMDKDQVSVKTHNLTWWVDYCFHTFGRTRALKLLSNPERPRYIRVNPLRNNGSLAFPGGGESLRYSLEPVLSVPGVYRVVKPPAHISQMISQGLMQFQDLASYCAVLAGGPTPGKDILDVCAAPGAKTSALAQQMGNSGEIVSVDYSRSRMKNWKSEMNRLGVEIANGVVADAMDLCTSRIYDLVLLDPPCSGTGILDRNPRMKWNLSRESIARYSRFQGRMLEEAYRVLGPAGRIIYSTCSVTLEENEDVVLSFLRTHPDMETRPLALGSDLGSGGMKGLMDCRRFYPYLDRTAGYFIARLEHIEGRQ